MWRNPAKWDAGSKVGTAPEKPYTGSCPLTSSQSPTHGHSHMNTRVKIHLSLRFLIDIKSFYSKACVLGFLLGLSVDIHPCFAHGNNFFFPLKELSLYYNVIILARCHDSHLQPQPQGLQRQDDQGWPVLTVSSSGCCKRHPAEGERGSRQGSLCSSGNPKAHPSQALLAPV